MNDIEELLKRQAEWQQSRKDLPWPEKIRMVAAIRDLILQLRAAGKQSPRRDASDAGNDR